MGDDSRQRRPREAAILGRVRELRRQTGDDACSVDSWYEVLQDLASSPVSDTIRLAFEEVVAAFPTAVVIWQRFAMSEMVAHNNEAVKQIFGRCLLSCPSVELWGLYLRFVRKSSELRGIEGLVELKSAYEFSLDVLGQDIAAGPIWQEYIDLLQKPKPGSAEFLSLFPNTLSGQEEQSRAVVVRRAFQRAVVVPTHYLDALYRLYETFESTNNKMLARKVLDEWKPRYMAARQAYRDRKRKQELLTMAVLPMEPGMGGLMQTNQLDLWHEYLAFERSNPQNIDAPTLTARVSLAYDQMLIGYQAYPEVWYEYAHWHSEGGGGGAAAAAGVLARGIRALPACVMLRFTLGDVEEAAGKPDAARAVFEEMASGMEAETEAAAAAVADSSAPPPAPPAVPALVLPPEQGALAWVQYMRFLRRSGDAMGSRQLFLRARKWCLAPHHERVPWQVYAAAALLEWQVGRDSAVAAKIFEKGLEEPRLAAEPQYVLQYHRFLCDAGDSDNARALFDRVFADEANTRSPLLWQRYVQFEYELGNLAAAQAVERRARVALSEKASPNLLLEQALLKFQFQGTWPVGPTERRHFERLLGLADAAHGGGHAATLFTMAAEPLLLGYSLDAGADAVRLRGPMAMLLEELPDALGLEGAPVPPERVIDILLAADLSPSGVTKACYELEAQRHPINLRMGVPGRPRRPPSPQGGGPPPQKRSRGDAGPPGGPGQWGRGGGGGGGAWPPEGSGPPVDGGWGGGPPGSGPGGAAHAMYMGGPGPNGGGHPVFDEPHAYGGQAPPPMYGGGGGGGPPDGGFVDDRFGGGQGQGGYGGGHGGGGYNGGPPEPMVRGPPEPMVRAPPGGGGGGGGPRDEWTRHDDRRR